jgi:hypothetical protein
LRHILEILGFAKEELDMGSTNNVASSQKSDKTTNDALFNIGIRRPSSNQLTLLACLSALPVYMVVGLGFLTYYYQTRKTSTRQSSIGEGGGDDAR